MGSSLNPWRYLAKAKSDTFLGSLYYLWLLVFNVSCREGFGQMDCEERVRGQMQRDSNWHPTCQRSASSWHRGEEADVGLQPAPSEMMKALMWCLKCELAPEVANQKKPHNCTAEKYMGMLKLWSHRLQVRRRLFQLLAFAGIWVSAPQRAGLFFNIVIIFYYYYFIPET